MLLSIIIPCFNEEGNIIEINKVLSNTLKDLNYELIYINDGSTDKTLDNIKKIYNNDKTHIKYISFSKNFGKEAAIYSGIKNSCGKYTCIIDADLQQNPKYILDMLNKLEKNKDIDQIAMVAKNRKYENKKDILFKKCFYKLINKLSDIKLIDGASDFRMFRENVKNSILKLSETNRFSKGIFNWIGFNTEYMYYNVEKRYSGKTKYNKKEEIKYAITAITNYSTKPLYISFILGLLISIVATLYIIITLFQVLIFGKDVPGYASLLILILFFGGINLLFIGLIGIYIGKNYIETKKRPIYIEKEVKGFDEIL